MYKRIIVVLVLASMLLASCSAAQTTAAPTTAATTAAATEAAAATTEAAQPFAGVTLNMIDSPEGQTDAMIALENKCQTETGATLNVEVVPQDDVDTKMQTALAAKSSAYDLIGLDIIDLAKYDAAGWLEPLDSYIDDATKSDILPFALEGISYNGKILGLPWKAEYMVMVYNKKMLEDAGITAAPATWDELIQDSKTLKEKGIVDYPIAFTWGANYEQITSDYTMMVKSMGGQLFDDSGKPVFNTGAGVQALQMMYDMINTDKIVDPAALTIKGGGTRRDIVMGGNAAFVFLWGNPLVTMNDPANTDLAGDFEVALAPDGGAGHISLAGPMGMSISAYSQNKQAAWAMLKCIAGPEGEKDLFMKDGSPFGYTSVLNDPEVQAKMAENGGAVIAEQANSLAVRPSLPYYADWSSALQDTVQKVLTNQVPVQQGLDDLAAKTLELQSEYSK